jgi:chromosome segregation ATPase
MKLQTGGRWVAAAVILAGAVKVSGQSAAPAPARDDVLVSLLGEVRGLRAAMEQMASAGPRVQLFASRLQLQETRINNMLRRLDTVRDRMGESQQELARLQVEEKQLEAALGEQKGSTSAEAREEMNMATLLMGGVRGKMATASAALNRHTAEEAQLVAEITTEQGRWTAINQQLDELERALAKR